MSSNKAYPRILYKQNNNPESIAVVCVSGIHGNEPAGVYGLKRVIDYIEANNIVFNGNFYALTGNRRALEKGIRYISSDLNRLWTKKQVRSLKNLKKLKIEDRKEQMELYENIKNIIDSHTGKIVFVDLHTTSSQTVPFITISDSLDNRGLVSNFPMPIILGIEEYIDGPLLTYINEFGHTSLGFEAGQHSSKESIDNSEAFIWLLLEKVGLVNRTDFTYEHFEKILSSYNSKRGFFEIIHRHALNKLDTFRMVGNFNNFDRIKANQLIARHNNIKIRAKSKGFIFMPLYQDQGKDGFFIAVKISKFWLQLSTYARRLKLHSLLPVLPGVKKHPNQAHTLIVNKRIAALLTIKIFHLLGYRKRIEKDNKWHFIKRDREVSEFV